MREKKDVLARIAARLDLPREALPGGFSVLLSGESLCIQGRAAILTYGKECILLCVGKRRLRVQGRGLFCAELAAERVLINGHVKGLFWEEGDADAT